MRLDELPRSDNVEDRRGGWSGRLSDGSHGGIGIGTIIVLGLIG
jgi:predicted metalloprotease